MPLTFEQFSELRKQGLSPEQIAKFNAGNKPTSDHNAANTFTNPAFDGVQQGDPLSELGDFSGRFAKGAVDTAVSAINPKTYVNLANTAGNVGLRALELITRQKSAGSQAQATVTGIGDYYKNRYGGFENIKNTFYQDPFGTLLDVSTLIDIGGSVRGLTRAGSDVVRTGAERSRLSLFGKSYLPEVDSAAKHIGVTLPVSAVTKSRFLQGTEALLSKGLFGQKLLDVIESARTTLASHANSLADKLKPEHIMTQENLGKSIQEGVRDYEVGFKQAQNTLFEAFMKKHRNTPAVTTSTANTLAAIVEDQSKDIYGGKNPRLEAMMKYLAGENSETRNMRAQGYPEQLVQQFAKPPELTFEHLKATRTRVGEELVRDQNNTGLKRLYKALSDDMSKTLINKSKTLGKKLTKLSGDYKSGIQVLRDNLISSIQKTSPDRVAQKLISRNSSDALGIVKTLIGPERFQDISNYFLTHVIEKSSTRGTFDVEQFKSLLAKYDDPTLQQLFTPKQQEMISSTIAELEKNKLVSDALKKGTKISEGSQTAFIQKIARAGGETGAFATALVTGHAEAAAFILAAFGSEYGAARLFAPGFGRKFLTEGIPSKLPSRIKKAARVSNSAANAAARTHEVTDAVNDNQQQ